MFLNIPTTSIYGSWTVDNYLYVGLFLSLEYDNTIFNDISRLWQYVKASFYGIFWSISESKRHSVCWTVVLNSKNNLPQAWISCSDGYYYNLLVIKPIPATRRMLFKKMHNKTGRAKVKKKLPNNIVGILGFSRLSSFYRTLFFTQENGLNTVLIKTSYYTVF